MVGVINIQEMTLVQAWNELKKIENQISLYETLRETKNCKSTKAIELKQLLVDGGKVNNNALINAIVVVDEYTETLQSLYKSRNAYEKYILEEIDRMKISNPSIVIGFLKDHQKMTWLEISNYMDYSDAQCRRYYDEFKGKTPKNNTYIKDEQK